MKIKTPVTLPKARKRTFRMPWNMLHIIFNFLLGTATVVLMYFSFPTKWVTVGENDIASIKLDSPVNGWVLFLLAVLFIASVSVQQWLNDGFMWDGLGGATIIILSMLVTLGLLITGLAGTKLNIQNVEVKEKVSNSIQVEPDDTQEEIMEALHEESQGVLNGEQTAVYNKKEDRSGKYSKYYQYVGTVEEVLAEMESSK